MIQNTVVFIVNGDGSFFKQPPNTKFTANSVNKNSIFVIAPFVNTASIIANFKVAHKTQQESRVAMLTTMKPNEITNESYVFDWNVWEVKVPQPALQFLANNRGSEILVSFTVGETQVSRVPTKFDTILAEITDTEFILPSITVDGRYIVKVASYEYENGKYAFFNDTIIADNDNQRYIVYRAKYSGGTTPSVAFKVDPSIPMENFDEYEPSVVEQLIIQANENSGDIVNLENEVVRIDNKIDDEVNSLDQKVDAHIEDLDNPHEVTAEQVDTYNKLVIDNKDADTLQQAKDYTYSQVEIDNKDTAIMNKANNLENANMFKDVSYNNVTGVLTFTKYDDTTKEIDLPLELIVTSGYYDEVANELVLVLANASEIRIPVGNLLTDLDAHNIRFNGSGTNYLTAKTEVEGAIKELDTQVKSTNDTTAKLADLPGYNHTMPNLSNATDLGDGWYRYNTDNGITKDYNIFSGHVRLNGTNDSNQAFLHLFSNVLPSETVVSFTYEYVSGTADVGSPFIALFPKVANEPSAIHLKTDSTYLPKGLRENYLSSSNVQLPRIFFGSLSQGQTTFNDFTFKIQLEKGDTATPYTVPGQIPQYELKNENPNIYEIDEYNQEVTRHSLPRQVARRIPFNPNVNWVTGSVTSIGVLDNNTTRYRFEEPTKLDGYNKVTIIAKENFKFNVHTYTLESGTFIYQGSIKGGNNSNDFTFDVNSNLYYMVIMGRNDNVVNTNFVPYDIFFYEQLPLLGNITNIGQYSFPFFKSSGIQGMSNTDIDPLGYKTANDIYSLFDNLITEFPRNLSKELVGYADNGSGELDTNLPIYAYTYKQDIAILGSGLVDNTPNVIIMCGIHGNEKATTWSLYLMISKMLNGEEELAPLKGNITINFVPIVNPGGWNLNTRGNLAEQDVNRTFTGVGTSLESQQIISWLNSHNNIYSYIDFHNTANVGWYTYITTLNKNTVPLSYSSFVRQISNVWKNIYNFDVMLQQENEERFVFIKEPVNGTSNRFAYSELGIENAFTLESGNYDPITSALYTKTVIEMSLDIIVNMLYSIMKTYYS